MNEKEIIQRNVNAQDTGHEDSKNTNVSNRQGQPIHRHQLTFNEWTGKNNTRVVRRVPRGATCPMEEARKNVQNCSRKSEGKRPLGRPRCRWKNYVKMDSVL